jgi:hypothetical protein
MAINLTYIKAAFDNYDLFKSSINIGNYYSDNWFTPVLVLSMFALGLWVMRENQVETLKAFTVSTLLAFVVSLIFLSMQEIEPFIVTFIGMLLVVMTIYQKMSEN